MKKAFVILLALVAQSLAAQQVVPIQSGEHETFSRLVLRIDPEVDWEVDTARGSATIRFPNQSLSFSTDRIFDLIPRDRIVAVTEERTEEGSALTLSLNCACEVQSFAFKGQNIVFDVVDGPPLSAIAPAQTAETWRPDPLPFIQPSDTPLPFTAAVMAQSPAQPVLLPDPPAPVETIAADLAAPTLPDPVLQVQSEKGNSAESIVQLAEEMSAIAREGMNENISANGDPNMQARIEEAQSHLLAQLTRAADQGLIDFAPAPVEVVVEPEVIVQEVEEIVPDPALMQQLSARSAYAQSTEAALTEIVNQFAMPQCLDDALFSMAGWGGALGFSEQLASLRSQQIGEFDVSNQDITESIVRLYLRYGLGVEALLLLAESSGEIGQAALYRDMAYVLEEEPEGVTGPILKGVGCGGDHEMWYLSTGLGSAEVLEPITVTEAFSNYPIEVRTIIGPQLAQGLIARGQIDAGHVVLEIVRRADGEISNAQKMAEARVMEQQSDHAGAEEVFRELATSNDALAPEAMVAYAQVLIDSGSTVPPMLLLDIESASFLHRNTGMADILKLWEIRVRARVEGPDKALIQIEEILSERPHMADELQEVAAEILQQTRSETMGAYAFADMVLKHAGLLSAGEGGDQARLRIAAEMSKIGLPEPALDTLALNLTRSTPAVNLVAAAAYIQLFEPEKALAQLADDPSLAAFKIRLQANLLREDYAAVAFLLEQDMANEVSLNDYALRAGDWAKINDSGALGTLAAYVESGDLTEGRAHAIVPVLAPMFAEEAPSLKAARELLANNRTSRDFLENVLAETAPPTLQLP